MTAPNITAFPVTPTLVPHEIEEPTPLVYQTKPQAPYPVAALGPLRVATEAIQDMTQAPPAIAAQAVLGVAALAVQPIANVETLGGHAPCSHFLLTVAGSGERKSACDKLAMRGVRAFEVELAEDRAAGMASWRDGRDLWDSERKRILGEKPGPGKEKATALEADLHALGGEPEEPVRPIIVTPDPTVEGLVKNMGCLRPSLGMFSDEGGSFLGGVGMSSEHRLRTIATFSAFWDGAPVSRVRAGDGVSMFHGRRLSVHLMVQPVAAGTLLADPVANGQGFLARFLIVALDSAIGTRTRLGWSPESDAALLRFEERISALLRRPLPLRLGGGLDPRMLPLSPEAREIAESFYLDVEEAQAEGGELEAIRPFASKAVEHACRLAAVLTLFANPEAEAVAGQTMDDARTLATFYLNESMRLAGAAAVSAETADVERMRRWLVDRWTEPFISVTDAVQRGPFKDSAKVRRAFERLTQHRWLTPAEDPVEIMGKKRGEVWRVRR